MAYIRKTPANIVYIDNEKGHVERINNVTWLTTLCSQCGTKIKRKFALALFNKSKHFYCDITCLNESQRSGKTKELKEAHFLKKYGTKNPLSSPKIIENCKQTLLDRYGVDNISKLQSVKEKKSIKMKQICKETDFLERITNTMFKRYGQCWLATKEARELLKQYAINTYGVEHHMKSPQHKEERRIKFNEKYGVDNPLQLEEIKEKVRKTCLRLYGVDNIFKRPDVIEKRITKLVHNAKQFTSQGEENINTLLMQHYTNVERHIPIFYRKTSFWIIDYKIDDIYIQYDGLFWHGINKNIDELKQKKVLGNKVANMQLAAINKDRYQNKWFNEHDLKLFRIIEGVPSETWLPQLNKLFYITP